MNYFKSKNPVLTTQQKKICPFCTNKETVIDYKDADLLNRFISGQAKIKKTKRTGVCAKHQRVLAQAIKRARILALLPAASGHSFFQPRDGGYRNESFAADGAEATMAEVKEVVAAEVPEVLEAEPVEEIVA